MLSDSTIMQYQSVEGTGGKRIAESRGLEALITGSKVQSSKGSRRMRTIRQQETMPELEASSSRHRKAYLCWTLAAEKGAICRNGSKHRNR